ncbi:alpha/beta fold hydrolase [Paenibacillus eucommiae]|uniref:Pimeloyl-ACP methyl ester carboxylesterase n=1 Tax=Paenibacillus eucommiae TaxID=1355755 RepID=A0ABS4ITG7_9BACL|nr:alpha/beta hydrolase [Paenibacillus eucommiae]MBP1989879.1 pimeloyl-ACP methyl ester carboxylesterase [Paenibacillus eucommiae]
MLYHREYGNPENETILFLHGGGLSGSMWEDVVSHLDDFHCVVPDLPEHGKSAKVRPLTTGNCVEQLEALLKNFEKVHIVGLSLGGAIALSMLISKPERIKSVIISGTAAGISKTTAALLNSLVAPIYGMLSEERIAKSMMKGFRIPEQYKQSLMEDAKCMNTGMVRGMHTMLSEIKMPRANDKPLLILVGEQENRVAKKAMNRLLMEVPLSKGAIVPEVGHVWSYEVPHLFAEVVRQWVSDSHVHPSLIETQNRP